jgi:hypothetical protein
MSIEFPEYLICPLCKNQIKIQYTIYKEKTRWPYKTKGIFAMRLRVPVPTKSKSVLREKTVNVCACENCKSIIGINFI